MQTEQSRFTKDQQSAPRKSLLKPRSKFKAVTVDPSSLTRPEKERVSAFILPAVKPLMETYGGCLAVKRFLQRHITDKLDPKIRNASDTKYKTIKKQRARKDRLSKYHLYNKITDRESLKVKPTKTTRILGLKPAHKHHVKNT